MTQMSDKTSAKSLSSSPRFLGRGDRVRQEDGEQVWKEIVHGVFDGLAGRASKQMFSGPQVLEVLRAVEHAAEKDIISSEQAKLLQKQLVSTFVDLSFRKVLPDLDHEHTLYQQSHWLLAMQERI